MAVSTRDGQVSLPVDLGGTGSYKAQWRVIKDLRTAWTSGHFNLTVVGSGKTRLPSGASAIYNIARRSLLAANASTPGAPRSMRTEDTFVTATPRSGGSGSAAESVAKATTSALDSIGTGFLGGFTGIVYAAPTQWLFSLIFGPSQTQKELTELSQEVTQGFSTVEAQLSQIQAQLASLQIQVTAVQNQVTSANASASAAACDTQIDSAQGYVTDIQAIAGNYKVALSPAWIRQNLVGKTPIAAANTLGA